MALFFKTRKPRQFEYIPRFYDEEKEKLEQRRKELENAGEEVKNFSRGDLKKQWLKSDRKKPRHRQPINLLVYLILILVLLYIIFF